MVAVMPGMAPKPGMPVPVVAPNPLMPGMVPKPGMPMPSPFGAPKLEKPTNWHSNETNPMIPKAIAPPAIPQPMLPNPNTPSWMNGTPEMDANMQDRGPKPGWYNNNASTLFGGDISKSEESSSPWGDLTPKKKDPVITNPTPAPVPQVNVNAQSLDLIPNALTEAAQAPPPAPVPPPIVTPDIPLPAQEPVPEPEPAPVIVEVDPVQVEP